MSLPVRTLGLSVSFRIDLGNQSFWIATELPFTEQYHYSFPANFGTWQVDNLSAPGGSGGGWAFSYSPCP